MDPRRCFEMNHFRNSCSLSPPSVNVSSGSSLDQLTAQISQSGIIQHWLTYFTWLCPFFPSRSPLCRQCRLIPCLLEMLGDVVIWRSGSLRVVAIVLKTRAQEENRSWQPNSLVIRRAKLNNGLLFRHVYRGCARSFGEAWRAMLGERFLWPPYLGPSVSIRQHSLRSPLAAMHPPTPIRPPAPTHVLYYHTLLSQRSETRAEDTERRRRGRFRLQKEKKKRPSFHFY